MRSCRTNSILGPLKLALSEVPDSTQAPSESGRSFNMERFVREFFESRLPARRAKPMQPRLKGDPYEE